MDRRCERGSGLLGSAIGVAVVIGLLGFAVNVTLGLWARSTVDAVAYDAARRLATTDITSHAGASATEAAVIADARAMLGDYGSTVEMEFLQQGDPELVVLRLRAPGVSLLPRLIGGGPVVGAIEREIVVRREDR
ncbi:MAG: hypothetical protein WBF71_01565 [Microthrixaceae bacterium]